MTHHHNHPDHHEHSPKRGLHQDWRVWVAVVLMLGAMLVYVFSEDESDQPGQPPGERVPAAAE